MPPVCRFIRKVCLWLCDGGKLRNTGEPLLIAHLTVILWWYRWQWWQVWLLKHCFCLPLHGLHGLVCHTTVIGFSIFLLDHSLVAVLILFGRLNPRIAAISGATSAEVSRKQKFAWHGMFKAKWFKVCRTELNGSDSHGILQPAHF